MFFSQSLDEGNTSLRFSIDVLMTGSLPIVSLRHLNGRAVSIE
jgi:hypothetical protein